VLGTIASPQRLSAQTDDDSLSGEFAVTIGRLDVPFDLPNGPSLLGRWRISFSPDGTYEIARQDVGPVVTGFFELDGERITLTDESGLLACTVGPDGETDVSTGTYRWELIGTERLSLLPIEEQCQSRRILLSTRELTAFVACLTGAQVTDGATPTPEAELSLAALLGTPAAGPSESDVEIAEEIDWLLAQMTACWTTGDPSLFLPLLSSSFLPQFKASLGADDLTDAEFNALLQQAMAVPFVFERAGDLNIQDATHVSAIVRTQIAGSEDFTRFRFVLEDGAWRWDGVE